MKKSNIKDWHLWGQWYDIYWFHSCYGDGLVRVIKNKIGYGPSEVIIEQDKNIQTIYLFQTEWKNIGKTFLAEVLQEPKKLSVIVDEINQHADELLYFSKRLKKLNASNFSKKAQLNLLHEYHIRHHALWSVGQVPNVLELENTLLTDYLKNWLARQKLSDKKQTEYFQTLIMPRKLSQAQHEERDMLRLAIKKNPTPELKRHWKKYSWLQFGWTGPSLTQDYFSQIHRMLYEEGKAKQILSKMLAKDKRLVSEKHDIIKALDMPAEIVKVFKLLEDVLYAKAHRMDALYVSYEAVQPLLKKIAKQHFISLNQIYGIYIGSLIDMMEQDFFDIHKINHIAKYSVKYFANNKEYFLAGQKARDFMKPIKKNMPKIEDITELSGEVAFPGKVKGKVVIINQSQDMKKFNKGDILVSNVTDPSLLPAMKKAKAFITNMGGLTCHAAIVARELETPCVIGTKIATHVLQDGDRVEVDAHKGVVTKIK